MVNFIRKTIFGFILICSPAFAVDYVNIVTMAKINEPTPAGGISSVSVHESLEECESHGQFTAKFMNKSMREKYSIQFSYDCREALVPSDAEYALVGFVLGLKDNAANVFVLSDIDYFESEEECQQNEMSPAVFVHYLTSLFGVDSLDDAFKMKVAMAVMTCEKLG